MDRNRIIEVEQEINQKIQLSNYENEKRLRQQTFDLIVNRNEWWPKDYTIFDNTAQE